MPDQLPEESDFKDRLLAMKLIRENMFLDQPRKYSLSDIAEDLPGSARAVAPILKNVLPSASIISSDPEERKAQIRNAIEKIKATRHSKSELGKEILKNVYNMGVGSLTPGFMLAAAFHLMGFRSPRKAGLQRLAAKIRGKSQWQSPVTPVQNIKSLFNKPGYAKDIAKKSINEALVGAGMAAGTGVAYPLIAHNYHVSDKALDEARKVMEEQPYVTSLPVSEMMSVIKEKRDNMHAGIGNAAKNMLMGAGIGAGTGVAGAFTPTAVKAIGYALKNLATKRPLMRGIGQLMSGELKRDLKNSAQFGAGLGALSGVGTHNLVEDEYENISHNQA